MKNNRFISLIMALIMLVNFFTVSAIQAFAHNSMLEVDYDNCQYSTGDGIDEMWYVLNVPPNCYHLSHEENTIKYYFEEASEDGNYTWTSDVSESVAEEIKEAYANSMKKWNNVYFYTYDSSGNVTKNKIINIVEGTASDHNLSIYPETSDNYLGMTIQAGTGEVIESETIKHKHYSEWKMVVYVNHYYINRSTTEARVSLVRERTGAHEMGHVLGVFDVDSNNLCNSEATSTHHHEVLMGYGNPLTNRAYNITYKDIAGVAITRGFHTDNDHKWINFGLQSAGTYKLVCSICNGVKNVSSLSGYTYNTYNACNGNHTLSSGNMMAVASYGTKDYYKCKYCRYVAPFSSIVEQNYIKTYHSNSLHKCVNNVTGLEYTFYEKHNFVNNQCTGCGFVHTHSYVRYVYYDNATHRGICSCSEINMQSHYIRMADIVNGRYATCLGCNTLLDLRKDIANFEPTSIYRVSANGSYVLPSGVVVLVDADIEAYINGTLVFYESDDFPVVD